MLARGCPSCTCESRPSIVVRLAASLQDNRYIVMQNSSLAAARDLICAGWRCPEGCPNKLGSVSAVMGIDPNVLRRIPLLAFRRSGERHRRAQARSASTLRWGRPNARSPVRWTHRSRSPTRKPKSRSAPSCPCDASRHSCRNLRLGRIVTFGPRLFMHRDMAEEARRAVRSMVDDFHRQSPESPGMTGEQLRSAAPFDHEVLDGVVALLRSAGRLVEQQGRWTPEHQPPSQIGTANCRPASSPCASSAFEPPNVEAIAGQTGLAPDEVRRAVRILCEHQRLIRVEEGLLSTARPWPEPARFSRTFAAAKGWKASSSSTCSTRADFPPVLLRPSRRDPPVGNTRFLKAAAKAARNKKLKRAGRASSGWEPTRKPQTKAVVAVAIGY